MLVTMRSIVATLILSCSLLLGQPPGGGPMNMDPAQRQEFMLDMLSGQLGLDKDQRSKMKQLLDSARKEMAPLQSLQTKNDNALREAVKAGKPEAEVAKFARTAGGLEEQLAALQSHTFRNALALLKPVQKPNADMLFEMLSMMSRMEGRGAPVGGMMGMPPGMGPGGPRPGGVQQ